MRAIGRGSRRALAAFGVVALLSVCCAAPSADAPGVPEQVALQLFDLAHSGERAAGQIERLVEVAPDSRARTTLLDALDQLGRYPAPRVAKVVPLPGVDRVAVDLVAEGPGAGTAHFSVQLGQDAGSFKVRWFAGPGISWPAHSTLGEGLANSPAAETTR